MNSPKPKRMCWHHRHPWLWINLENGELAVHTAGVFSPLPFASSFLPWQEKVLSFSSSPERIHSPWWPKGSLSPLRWFFSKWQTSQQLLFLRCWFNVHVSARGGWVQMERWALLCCMPLPLLVV